MGSKQWQVGFAGVFLAASFALAGCGGSSSTSSTAPSGTASAAVIKGCACAGAPMVGYVEVRDSSASPQPVKTNIPILANGNYTVDVTGLQPPFAFLAIGTVGGKSLSLYSAATKEDIGGTINITPFTDLMIRNIAASAVDAYINQGNFSNLTATQLDAQRVALTNQLAPALNAMGLSGSIDLLRATFNADGTGLDKFMDVVKVSTTSTTATITNILDAANQLIINTTNGTSNVPTLSANNLSPSGTPVDQITQKFQSISTFFATRLPSPTDPDYPNLVALFSGSHFLDSGEGLDAFLNDITTDKNNIGLQLVNIVVDSIDTTAGTAQVHFAPKNAAGVCLAHDQVGCSISWYVQRNNNGVWQADGNQRIAEVRIRTRAEQEFCTASLTVFNCSPTGVRSTGLNLNINNQGLQPIGSAVVTGPGLGNGVTLTAQPGSQWLMFSVPSSNCQGCTTNFFVMTDTQINTIAPNSVYTIKLYDNSPTPVLLATYTDVLPQPPVLNSALTTVVFPTITNRQSLAGITTATLTPGWQIPAGLFGDLISVFMYQSNSLGQTIQNQNVRNDLTTMTGTSGTATLVVTAPSAPSNGIPWTNGTYWIGAFDQYGGDVVSQYLP